ncbi:hypothetical protein [Jiella sp. M17.18]|uniref:hypothetical protein n=1 Tax=Jiella sp. M17.18 TaxID=3234247 RepID=UPI0034DEB53F
MATEKAAREIEIRRSVAFSVAEMGAALSNLQPLAEMKAWLQRSTAMRPTSQFSGSRSSVAETAWRRPIAVGHTERRP